MVTFRVKKTGINHKKVMVIFPHLGGKSKHYILVTKILELAGYYCLTYEYSENMLVPDAKASIENFITVRDDAIKKIVELKQKGISSFSVFGTSLGTMLAILLANTSSDISTIILNLTGANLGETIWSWDEVWFHNFKKQLRKSGLTKDQVKKAFSPISPDANYQHITNAKIFLFLSSKDKLIPFSQGQEMYQLLKQKNSVKTTVHKFLGHYGAGIINLLSIPFSLLFRPLS